MANDAKLGLVLGVGIVVFIGIVFFREGAANLAPPGPVTQESRAAPVPPAARLPQASTGQP
jgi:hypothetical protein